MRTLEIFVQAARLAEVYPAALPDAVHRLEGHFGSEVVSAEVATAWLCEVLALRAPHLWQDGKVPGLPRVETHA